MQTVYTIKAKYAIVYRGTEDYVGQTGIALRQEDGSVWFRAEATGWWQPLVDADLPQVQFCGDVALADTQALLDGNLVAKASRTLERRAA
jgi:hypothetical protein